MRGGTKRRVRMVPKGASKKHGGQGSRPSKDNQQERTAQGRDKKQEDDDHDESGEQGF